LLPRWRIQEQKLLHGWLDNSDTFIHLAPELTSLGNVYAFDGPGGHRCHLDGDTRPVILAVKRFLNQ
jgi:hypothetical protein